MAMTPDEWLKQADYDMDTADICIITKGTIMRYSCVTSR